MFPEPFNGLTVNVPAEQIVCVWAITFGVGLTVIVTAVVHVTVPLLTMQE